MRHVRRRLPPRRPCRAVAGARRCSGWAGAKTSACAATRISGSAATAATAPRLCPRGADPAAVMAALRADACRRLSGLPLPAWLEGWGLALLGLLGWFLIWLIRAVQTGSWFPTVRSASGTDSIVFAALYPVGLIDAVFLLTALAALLILARGAYRQRQDYTTAGGAVTAWPACVPPFPISGLSCGDGLTGRDFARCRLPRASSARRRRSARRPARPVARCEPFAAPGPSPADGILLVLAAASALCGRGGTGPGCWS